MGGKPSAKDRFHADASVRAGYTCFMNRLAQESSPYLKQHADNPVDWYPWGPEALETAKREGKPILLSVGYSACHWCHVMAHESFEDPATAELMNRFFVNIKVDREERPDLDQLYQGVVQLMNRGGGWPLTVFLTPELRPFFAGTYFPPQDRYGMPGFPKLLQALDDAWRTKRSDVDSQAQKFEEGLGFLSSYGLDAAPAEIEEKDLLAAAHKLLEEVDPDHGGFGAAPKFPNPMNVALLLRAYRRNKNPELLSAVTLTLRKMAQGGLYDQLGGGFHRYSVDAVWRVPHFEKMLYDNAQLIHLYSEMQQVAPNPLWEQTVRESIAYLQREMTAADGTFFAAQDADSEGVEGKFFVWKRGEVEAVLGKDEASLFCDAYNVTDAGNFEHGNSVLELKVPAKKLASRLNLPEAQVVQRLKQSRERLFAERAKRVRPGLDDKILAGWNGLVLRGLAFASRVFQEPAWAAAAARAADTLLSSLWKEGRLSRVLQEGRARIDAFVEDYGDLALGLVEVFQATGDPRYLQEAQNLAEAAQGLFWVEERQAYLQAPKGQKDLLCATYALHDNAYPSGASTLTEAWIRLSALTGKPEQLDKAAAYLKKMRDAMAQNPFAFGHLWLAADVFLDGAPELTVVGPAQERAKLVRAFHQQYAPTWSLLDWKGGVAPDIVAATLEGRTENSGKADAYICRHFRCAPPVSDPAALQQKLKAEA